MILRKDFKGQTHIFDVEDKLAIKLLEKDKRYSKLDKEVIKEEVKEDFKVETRGRPRKTGD